MGNTFERNIRLMRERNCQEMRSQQGIPQTHVLQFRAFFLKSHTYLGSTVRRILRQISGTEFFRRLLSRITHKKGELRNLSYHTSGIPDLEPYLHGVHQIRLSIPKPFAFANMNLGGCSLANATLLSGFCAYKLPIDVGTPRMVVAVGTSNILALDSSKYTVAFFFDSNGDGVPDSRVDVVSTPGLNHGLALHDGYIWASSSFALYRWTYEDGFNTTGPIETVLTNIRELEDGTDVGGHATRTMAFDKTGRLYVSVGSTSNVDTNSFRARIRRFNLTQSLPVDFRTGEVYADGLRNEVGLAFDRHGVLWGVENGADNLMRSDLGGDIHNDNPVCSQGTFCLYTLFPNILTP